MSSCYGGGGDDDDDGYEDDDDVKWVGSLSMANTNKPVVLDPDDKKDENMWGWRINRMIIDGVKRSFEVKPALMPLSYAFWTSFFGAVCRRVGAIKGRGYTVTVQREIGIVQII
jgi:hypothetical protein